MKTRVMIHLGSSLDVPSSVRLVQGVLAQDGVGQVTLVRVVPFSPAAAIDFPLDYWDWTQADAIRRQEAKTFLREIADKIEWGSVEHELVALLGDETEALARLAATQRFDAIAMVSRPRSWLGRLFRDGLAERLLAAARVPVMVLPRTQVLAHPA